MGRRALRVARATGSSGRSTRSSNRWSGWRSIPLGLATYMAYLWVLRGDPLYFSHVQAHWGRYLAPPWVSFGHSIAHDHRATIRRRPSPTSCSRSPSPLLMLGVLVIGFRRLRASYIAYMAVSILVPLSTVEPDEHAALRARPLPDVRAVRAVGREADRQQRHRRLLAARCSACSRCCLRIGTGSLERSDAGRTPHAAARGPPVREVRRSSARRGSSSTWSSSRCLQRVVPNHAATGRYNVIYSIAFLSGGVSNYFLNRAWTFRSTGHVGREGLSFMAVSVLALIVGLIVVGQLRRRRGSATATRPGSSRPSPAIVVNFFVNKYWTFRSAD